jgi:acyl-CoA synthetase (NDP forming)
MDLRAFTAPHGIAVVGASNDPDRIGGRPLSFLLRAGFAGPVRPVNPRGGTIQGLPALTRIEDLPGDCDLAVLAVPGAAVAAAVEGLGARGVRAAVVFASDLDEGAQAALKAAARTAGVRVLGPNTLGLFSTGSGCFATFSTALDGVWPRSGPISVVSQSGAFGSYLYALIDAAGGGLRHMITTGNGLDLDLPEVLEALVGDDETTTVVLAFEGIRDGRRLMAAIRALRAAGKPVVAMKSGRSEAGQRAAATHTGALAGEDAVLDAVLAAAGAVRARTMREGAELAAALAQGLHMPGRRLGIVTTSGGVGVLAADHAEEAGLTLPPLPGRAAEVIRTALPMAGTGNPIDSSTGILADFGLFGTLVEAVQESGAYDGLLLYLAHIGRNPAHWRGVLPAITAARARRPDMPIVLSMLAPEGPRRVMTEHGVPVFEDPADAVRLMGFLARVAPLVPAPLPRADLPAPPARPLNEAEAMDWLGRAGLPVPWTRLARDAAEAGRLAAGALGRLAVKIASPDILHKSDVGGVRLDVPAAEVEAVADGMLRAVAARVPQARIDGVTLAEMVPDGPDLILGTLTDPAFGPVVMLGLGGVTAEVLRDVVFAPAPLSEAAAASLAGRLRGARLLDGFRGGPVADRAALAGAIARVADLAAAGAERGLTIEINPLRIRADGSPVCLDAVVTVGDSRGETP